MKKNILSIMLMLIIQPVFAITWVSVQNPNGKSVEIDIDSIKQEKKYYFYNIKFFEAGKKETIITIQASALHPYCARINYYTPEQYVSLNGDYTNITNNQTKYLEAVPFKSRAYAAYKKVDNIMKSKNKPQITF